MAFPSPLSDYSARHTHTRAEQQLHNQRGEIRERRRAACYTADNQAPFDPARRRATDFSENNLVNVFTVYLILTAGVFYWQTMDGNLLSHRNRFTNTSIIAAEYYWVDMEQFRSKKVYL